MRNHSCSNSGVREIARPGNVVDYILAPQNSMKLSLMSASSGEQGVEQTEMVTLSSTSRLDTLVADFKSLFASNPALLTNGQFQITTILINVIFQIVSDELSTILPNSDLNDAFSRWKDDRANAAHAAEILKVIKRDKLEAWLPKTVHIFSSDPKSSAFVQAAFGSLWTSSGVPAPAAVPDPTFDKLAAARKREDSACFETTSSLGRKLRTASSMSAPARGLFESGTVAGARIGSMGGKRQEIVYNPVQLADAMSKVGATIDRGIVYRAGVMSGENHTNVGKKFPDPEHWLLIFGRDGDQFAFWDSDSATTNISRLGWGAGFGLLFYRNNRFSTAADPADFANVSGPNHVDEPVRHCYQVYNLTPYF